MRIHRVSDHDVTPDEVFATSCLEAFQEQKCRDAGSLSWDIDITVDTDADTAVVRVRRTLAPTRFPSRLRRFVGGGLPSTETITWGPPRPDGGRRADFVVDIPVAPVRLGGLITVSRRGDAGARVVVDSEFRVLVPVMAGRIEKLCAPVVLGIIEAEEETGRAWHAPEA